MWQAIEKFYSCVIHASATTRPARVIVPGNATVIGPLTRTLQAAFSGSIIAVDRLEGSGLNVCGGYQPSDRPCCGIINATARPFVPLGIAQLHVSWHYTMDGHERRSMRSFVYANHGFDPALLPDTVMFVTSGNSPSNGRRLDGEADVVHALRDHLARSHPELKFAEGSLGDLSFAEEVRLLRRTRVLVSLFGSALHGCRLLPPGSIVVEIHGALKEDWHAPGYAALCANSMRLYWIGLAAQNAVPAFMSASAHSKKSNASYRLSADYATARINSSELLRVIDAGLRADWHSALRSYPLPVFGAIKGEHAMNAHAIRSGVKSALWGGTMKALLGLPQYRTKPWWLLPDGWNSMRPQLGGGPPPTPTPTLEPHLSVRDRSHLPPLLRPSPPIPPPPSGGLPSGISGGFRPKENKAQRAAAHHTQRSSKLVQHLAIDMQGLDILQIALLFLIATSCIMLAGRVIAYMSAASRARSRGS